MKKVLISLITISLVFTIYSCKQKTTGKIEEEIVPQYTEAQLYEQLSKAIKVPSSDSLDLFFSQWNRSIKPDSNLYIEQNDTLKAIFSAFKAFYSPNDLSRLQLDGYVDNGVNAGTRYFVVQKQIQYFVVFSDILDIDEDVDLFVDEDGKHPDNISGMLNNFRPPVYIEADKVLYATDEYNGAVTRLLEEERRCIGDNNIGKENDADYIKDYKRISEYISVLPGHWGYFWHIDTHPYVDWIIFNNKFTRARIDYRIKFEGASTIMEKVAGEWKIIESKWTWIE
jgi:hypothetical protein